MTARYGPVTDSPLSLSPLPDGRRWRLDHQYFFSVPEGDCSVPRGFVTDLASTPRMFWVLYPPFGRYTWAAVGHDYLYRLARFGSGAPCSRAQADRAFWHLARHHGTPPARAWLLWASVRAGAWLVWYRYRQAETARSNHKGVRRG